MYNVFKILANVVDIGAVYYINNKFFNKKDTYKFEYIVVLTIIQSKMMIYINIFEGCTGLLNFMFIIVTSFVVSYIFYDIKIRKFFILIFSYILILLILDVSTTVFLIEVFKLPKDYLLLSNVYKVITIIIIKFLQIIIILGMIAFYKKKEIKNKLYAYQIIFILVINILILLFILKILSIKIYSIQNEEIFIAVIIIVISFISIIIIRKIIDYSTKEFYWKLTEKEYKNQIKYYKNYICMLNELRVLKHDFNNHIINLKEYMSNKEYSKALLYTDNLISEVKKADKIIKIDNETFSVLINYKYCIMNKNKIKFDYYINVLQDIHIKATDMTIILGNALDNAIEACKKVSINKRFIYMKANYGMGKLKIVIKNSKVNKLKYKNGKIITSKNNKIEHGLGIDNIYRVVNKYYGQVTINEIEDVFTIKIII